MAPKCNCGHVPVPGTRSGATSRARTSGSIPEPGNAWMTHRAVSLTALSSRSGRATGDPASAGPTSNQYCGPASQGAGQRRCQGRGKAGGPMTSVRPDPRVLAGLMVAATVLAAGCSTASGAGGRHQPVVLVERDGSNGKTVHVRAGDKITL